jgi:hypothetical protein
MLNNSKCKITGTFKLVNWRIIVKNSSKNYHIATNRIWHIKKKRRIS